MQFLLGEVILKLKLLPVFLLLIILISCSPKTDGEIFYDAQKEILSLNSYKCRTEVTVKGNKKPTIFTAQQWYEAPDKYRIEILSPESLNGKVTIYNGKRAWISNPRIGQSWVMQNSLDSLEENIFLGSFIHNFVNSEEVKIERKKLKSKEFIVLETEIPGNHPYFNKEILWFSIDDYKPYLLQLIDKDGEVRVDVRYYEFEKNNKLDDNIFKIQGNNNNKAP